MNIINLPDRGAQPPASGVKVRCFDWTTKRALVVVILPGQIPCARIEWVTFAALGVEGLCQLPSA